LQQSEDSLKNAEKIKKEKSKKEAALTGKKINLNKATKEELMALPGVGEKTAEKIIQYRMENNGFKSKDEIMEVKGIGPKKYEKMKEYLTIE
jgi:competence protein ComEA